MRLRGLLLGLLLLGGGSGGALAQLLGSGAPPATLGAELRGLASRAGVVFVGQVVRVEFVAGVVEITFAVEQPLRGVVGGSYVMREWAGRWTGGEEHFRLGQRAMFFLHGANGAGISSAVDGMMGAVPVVPMGAKGAALLDVRWVATRVHRAVGAPLLGAAGGSQGGIALADGVAVVKSWDKGEVEEPKGVRLPEGLAGTVGNSAGKPGPGVGTLKEADDAQL
jgi:hypothetical protein